MERIYGVIETPQHLIKWATEINQTIGMMKDSRKADLQDVYMRSTQEQIDNAWLAPENEHARKLIICSVNNILAFEEVERLLNVLARHKCLKQRAIDEKEFEQREHALYAREHAYRDAQKPIHKKIRELKDRIAILEKRNSRLAEHRGQLVEQLTAAINHDHEYEKKAEKYDRIKQALQD